MTRSTTLATLLMLATPAACAPTDFVYESEPPSCRAGTSCGGLGCCHSTQLPAGTYAMGRAVSGPENDVCSSWVSMAACNVDEQPERSVTVSSFRLDTFEVTVGRFRRFVRDYPASRPAAGAGAHPKIADSGWRTAWDVSLAADRTQLVAGLKTCPELQNWTDGEGSNENKPINCVSWFEAFAFCAWDGGRLPTEAEWEYAAAGGGENRIVPWGNDPPNKSLAVFGCLFAGTNSCDPDDLPSVGSTPAGAARWGHQDLSGSLWEYTFDAYRPYAGPCTDCAIVGAALEDRALRGGGYYDSTDFLRATNRGAIRPTQRSHGLGMRCARNP